MIHTAKNKVLETVVSVAGNIDPSLGKTISQAVKGLGSINVKALAVGAAVGTVAVATAKAVASAGKQIYNLGSDFDGAYDAIRVGTGATGEALASLQDDFKAVYSSVPTTMENAGMAISDYNTRLGLTGDALQDISGQAIQVSSLLDEDLGGVIEGSSKAFQQWNIDAENMGGAMDYAFKVSQATGTGFTDLMNTVQQFGPQLQEMGYGFEDATALIGQLDKAGVNTSEVLAAMKKSVAAMANEGLSASDGINQYFEAIQNAGDATEATRIATEVFGTRAASSMATAIRDGSLSVDDFTASLEANGETIASAAADTYDAAEYLQMFKQKAQVALEPLATTIFSSMSDMMPMLSDTMEELTPIIQDAVAAAQPFVEDFLIGMGDTLKQVLPMIVSLSAKLLPILTQLLSTLLPPLLMLIEELLPPLMQVLETILPPIAGILSTILPMLTQIIGAVLPVLAQLIAALLPIISPLLDLALQLINSVIMPLLPPFQQIVEALLPPLTAILQALMPILSPIVGILAPIAELLGTIVGWIAKVVEWVASGLGWVVDLFTGNAVVGDNPAGYATGGFTNGLSIAGEDPRYPTEAVISFNPAYRSENLAYWQRAGRMLGAIGDDVTDTEIFTPSISSTSIVYDLTGLSFAPVIKVEGNADAASLIKKLQELEPEFVDFVLEALARREEGAYVTADSGVY